MSIDGRITPSEHDSFHAGLYPEITEETEDGDLLQVRREAQKICEELGFPERPSYY